MIVVLWYASWLPRLCRRHVVVTRWFVASRTDVGKSSMSGSSVHHLISFTRIHAASCGISCINCDIAYHPVDVMAKVQLMPRDVLRTCYCTPATDVCSYRALQSTNATCWRSSEATHRVFIVDACADAAGFVDCRNNKAYVFNMPRVWSCSKISRCMRPC